jgi:hypothetical protein
MSPAVIATEDARQEEPGRLNSTASSPGVIKFRRIAPTQALGGPSVSSLGILTSVIDTRTRSMPMRCDGDGDEDVAERQKEPRRKASEKKTERAEAISLDRFITLGLSKAL